MACGCKGRKDRLAAKRAVTASAQQTTPPKTIEQFGPARWPGTPTKETTNART